MLKSFFRIIAFSLLLSACKTTVNTGSSTSEETKIYRAGTYRSAYTRRADLINTKLFSYRIISNGELIDTGKIGIVR